jgi:asparagine N-glycosylation enzyme membrane subunit Stt3
MTVEELKSRSLLARMKGFEFPWWAFVLFGALAGFVAADGLARIIGKRAMEPSAIALTLVLLLTGIPSAAVGLTRLARWAWKA